jgi:hypothetical protein
MSLTKSYISNKCTSLGTNNSGQYIVGFTFDGSIYTSSDYGITFNQSGSLQNVNNNNKNNLIVSDFTGQYFTIVQDAGVIVSSNYGSSWSSVISGSPQNLNSIVCNSNGTLLIGSDGSNMWTSYNRGNSWSSFSANIKNISGNSSCQYLVGVGINDENVYTSIDYGETWNLKYTTNIISNSDLFTITMDHKTSVCINNTGTTIYGLIGGSYNNGFFISTDSGNTWTTMNIPGWSYNLSCSYDGKTVVVSSALLKTSSGSGIYYSTNSGNTWTSMYDNMATDNWIYSAVSGNGKIITSGTFSDTFIATFNVTQPPLCFKEGTKILCLIDHKESYVPIENIKKGTFVKTLLHGYVPVDMIGKSKIYNPSHNQSIKNRLYKCSQNDYPELLEDLILTGMHSILVKSLTQKQIDETIQTFGRIFMTDKHYRLLACLDNKAMPYEIEGDHSIWHLSLENDNYYTNYGIYANGLLVESASKRMLQDLSNMECVE